MNKIGRNRANDPMSIFLETETSSKNDTPCIFLSHRSLDKETVRKVANYIAKAGIDYYLDEEDYDLQDADKNYDDEKVVKCINQGIQRSTHFLCFLSPNALSSLWMPYEMGYSKKAEKKIDCLKIKTVNKNILPSFYKAQHCMMGLSEFNAYLKQIADPNGGLFFFENRPGVIKEEIEISEYNEKQYNVVMKKYNETHPLYNIIDA